MSFGMENLGIKTIFVASRPATRELREAQLVVVEGPDKGRCVTIRTPKAYVGRSAVCELCLSDPKVSATHLVLEASEDATVLRDLDSTHGTYYAGARVRELFLESGLTFQLGSTSVRFDVQDTVVEIALSAGECFGDVAGRSLAMREVFAMMEKVAPTDLTVLLTGETGTGKERLARSVHAGSPRATGPFVVLDCSSIPRELAESAVFGHEKGSFTGAIAAQTGPFEQAHQGTIFLDEVGELDLELQPKLLRVLERREVRRVGGDQLIPCDVRVVAATNRDLRAMVAEGSFREDLYYRLSVVQCRMPALRERPDDIELLSQEMLAAFAYRRPDLHGLTLSQDAALALHHHPWPGNVRELKNVLERAISLADDRLLLPDDLRLRPQHPSVTRGGPPQSAPLELGVDIAMPFKAAKQAVVDRFERRYLDALMPSFAGNLSKAARTLGLTRFHLRELLKKHDLLGEFRDE